MSNGKAHLTPNQIKVLALVHRELCDKAIASELHMSPHTVRAHLRRIFVALDVPTRIGASNWYERYIVAGTCDHRNE